MGESSRRQLFRTVATGGVLAASALALGACGTEHAAAAGGPGTMIMIIRHGEKPENSGQPYGVTEDGTSDDRSLTVRGWTRAGALVPLFAPKTGPVRAGLATPAAIYASSGPSKRPMETVTPLAAALGQRLNTSYAKGDEAKLAKEVAARTGVTLVSWEHEAIPAIVDALGTVTPAPPAKWPDNRFDLVWVLRPAGKGWSLTQVPELLLDGDSDQPIS